MSEHYKLRLNNKALSMVKTINSIIRVFEYNFDKDSINIGDVKGILERLDDVSSMLEVILNNLNKIFYDNLQ